MRSTIGGTINQAVAAALMALTSAMPPLGHQTHIAVRPGSGVVKTRNRGSRHTPRVRSEAARLKHAAKMRRRYYRWACGLLGNRCIDLATSHRCSETDHA